MALPQGTATAAAGAAELLLATVGPHVAAAAAVLQQGRMNVVLVPGDILTVATEDPSPQPSALASGHTGTAAAAAATGTGEADRGPCKGAGVCTSVSFDYIDTSNVSDCT